MNGTECRSGRRDVRIVGARYEAIGPLGIGFIYTDISNRVHGFDLDSGLPVARTFEELFEICYTAQLK
jgi:hypothetical protein